MPSLALFQLNHRFLLIVYTLLIAFTTPFPRAHTILELTFPPLFLNSLIRVCTFWSSSSPSKTGLPRFLGCNSVISATLSSESVDSNSFHFLNSSPKYFDLRFRTDVRFKLNLLLKWAMVCGVECWLAYFPISARSAGDMIWYFPLFGVEVDSESLYTISNSSLHISVVLLSTDELSISKSCDFGLKKLKIDFVDILNVLLHLSIYKLKCPGKNTPGTKTHIVNTFQFDLCVYIHV